MHIAILSPALGICARVIGKSIKQRKNILKPAYSFPLMEINKLLTTTNTIKKQMLSRPATPSISHPFPLETAECGF